MASTLSGLDAALREKLIQRESRAEFLSCALFSGTCILLLIVLSFLGEERQLNVFSLMRDVFIGFLVLVSSLAILARKGWWHPAMSFVNTGLQVVLLSFFLVLVSTEKGPVYSLSTALPMLYCLAICITAFRLSPWLSLYAGTVSALSLILVYAVWMRPMLDAAWVEGLPFVTWPSIFARAIVYLSIGASCATAARTLRQQMLNHASDQNRISLLERTFGRLVAPEVARQILEDENWMRPAQRDAVVMFADLQGFTKYSEGRSPEDVANFLNRCWSVAADIVEQHGGVINKYMGDGFLAVFGVPIELADAEQAAALTATQLQKELAPILETEGLALCIGVHSGPMIAGGIGSESRCEFTVIGSTVNLASRLETLNRSLSTRCLTSESVAAKIASTWDLTDKGGHQVKGIAGEVSVFELGPPKPSKDQP